MNSFSHCCLTLNISCFSLFQIGVTHYRQASGTNHDLFIFRRINSARPKPVKNIAYRFTFINNNLITFVVRRQTHFLLLFCIILLDGYLFTVRSYLDSEVVSLNQIFILNILCQHLPLWQDNYSTKYCLIFPSINNHVIIQ